MAEVIKTELPSFVPSALVDSLETIPCDASATKILRSDGRCLVAVKFGGIRLPFYMSSGTVPKKGFARGQWYPIFGIGRKVGWLNKSDDVADYTNSPKLAKIAELLNQDLGDLSDVPGLIEAEDLPEDTLDFMNRDMRETDLVTDEDGDCLHDERGRVQVMDEGLVRNSILALTALIEAKDAGSRLAAAHRLAELDLESGKNPGTANSPDEYISARRAHYLTVSDPL